jgi:regulatory protein
VRDHSEQELRRKLSAPVMSKNGPEEIDATRKITTAWLPGAMSIVIWTTIALPQFLASRGRKGYGPARIRQELNQKGVARESIEKAMRECDIDWCELAKEQAIRKYGEPLPRDFQKKSKSSAFCSTAAF